MIASLPGDKTLHARRWRIGLLLFCRFCAGLRRWALAHIEASIVPAAAGGMGAKMRGPFDGARWWLKVISVDPDSDMARQGVQAGDRFSFDGVQQRLTVIASPQPGRVTTLHLVRQFGGLVESFLVLAAIPARTDA